MEEYIVQYGDTLQIIARKKLGDEKRWTEIAQLNNLSNPNQLLLGQKLKLPSNKPNIPANSIFNTANNPAISLAQQIPATILPARGYMFVVFEQLPEVGAKNVIRKVQVIPKDFSLLPKMPESTFSLAQHALGDKSNTQYLSTSNKSFGSPTMAKQSLTNPDGWKEVLLINTRQAIAGGSRVYTVPEVVASLRRYAATEPNNIGFQIRVSTLIRTIENVEGEVLIENGVNANAVRKITLKHLSYIETADQIWAAREAGKISVEQAEKELALLAKSYERAKIVGRVGRVLTVIGVVFTVADLSVAGNRSIERHSFRPLAAETVRQVGGWGGAMAGAEAGGLVGAWLGIETGPGAILTGGAGAIIFGAIGYWWGDVFSGWIDPPQETLMELGKDVNYAENLKNRDIELTVLPNESQYQFRRRALMMAATEVQKRSLRMVDNSLPMRFADKIAPGEVKSYEFKWLIGMDALDKNKDGVVNSKEWTKLQGQSFTYRLGENEVDELIRMVFGLTR